MFSEKMEGKPHSVAALHRAVTAVPGGEEIGDSTVRSWVPPGEITSKTKAPSSPDQYARILCKAIGIDTTFLYDVTRDWPYTDDDAATHWFRVMSDDATGEEAVKTYKANVRKVNAMLRRKSAKRSKGRPGGER